MTIVEPKLDAFLRGHAPAAAEDFVVWRPGELEFRASTWITGDQAPDHLVTSVRAVVTRGDEVLVMTEGDGSQHILPGGRSEAGESLVETLTREVKEETNLDIDVVRQLGVKLFTHQLPMPAGYAYPYPHFMQVVFEARATPDGVIECDDEWAIAAEFVQMAGCRDLIQILDRPFLDEMKTAPPNRSAID